MENYIMVNGRKIEMTDEQINQILSAFNKLSTIRLSEVAVGGTFKIGEHEFIVLEHSGDTTAVIRKELLPDSEFSKTNNYNGSTVELRCNDFANEIAAVIGEENIIQHTVDLTSNDGLKDYGMVKCRASLLTANRYRRYVEILDNFKPDAWWWLATAFSTARHDNDSWVLCVSPSGFFDYYSHCLDVLGVRPFCILKSDIFVSK